VFPRPYDKERRLGAHVRMLITSIIDVSPGVIAPIARLETTILSSSSRLYPNFPRVIFRSSISSHLNNHSIFLSNRAR
jgi:hypothetical protein